MLPVTDSTRDNFEGRGNFRKFLIHKHSLIVAEFLRETGVIFCTLALLRPLMNNYSI